MKNRTYLLLAIIAVLGAFIAWYLSKPANSSLDSDISPASARLAAPLTPKQTNETIPMQVFGVPAPQSSLNTKGEEMRNGLAVLNNEDILLYGKVIDQFDAPVANAIVAGNIQINNGTRVGKDTISLATDANGLFTISGYKGKALGINVTKEGYVMAATNTRFIYSLLWTEGERYSPDVNNPTIITMWKLQGAEPLTIIDQRLKFRLPNGPVNFDLLTEKMASDGGDIKITLNRAPGIVSERTLQDWSARIEVVDGGMIETTPLESKITYLLPDSGYQLDDAFIMSTNGPHKWMGSINQMYFVRSRKDRIFAKVAISVTINSSQTITCGSNFTAKSTRTVRAISRLMPKR